VCEEEQRKGKKMKNWRRRGIGGGEVKEMSIKRTRNWMK